MNRNVRRPVLLGGGGRYLGRSKDKKRSASTTLVIFLINHNLSSVNAGTRENKTKCNRFYYAS